MHSSNDQSGHVTAGTSPEDQKHGRASKITSRRNSNSRTTSGFGRKLLGFLKETWKSMLALCIIGAVTGGVWTAPHAFNRLFPVIFFDDSGDIVWTQFAYPYQPPLFSSLAAALVAIIIPIGIILIAQIWFQSFCDASNAILGLAYSLVTGTFLQVVLKKTIGGLRPHFLSVCVPVLPEEVIGTGYKNIMFTIEQVCTGSDKGKIGFFYLSIYLFTHFKIQSRYRAEYWRMVACLLPILLATYLASTLVLNHHHHGYDVIFGSLIGIVVALFGYRMVFKSICDRRLNAIPSCHSDHNEDEDYLPR